MTPSSGPEITQHGAEQADKRLFIVGEKGADARKAWPDVEAMLRADVKRRFEADGAGKWRPLRDTTKERDARSNRDPRLMRSTGATYRSLTERQAKGGIRRRGKTQLRFGSKTPGATFENRAHPLLPVSDEMRRAMRNIIERHVTFRDGSRATRIRQPRP